MPSKVEQGSCCLALVYVQAHVVISRQDGIHIVRGAKASASRCLKMTKWICL